MSFCIQFDINIINSSTLKPELCDVRKCGQKEFITGRHLVTKIYIKGTHIRKDLGVALVRRKNQENVLAGQHG